MNVDFKLPVRYGLIGGFVMCLISILTYMFYRQLFGSFTSQMLFGLVTMGIMIFIPVWGAVTYKREHGGVIDFKTALVVAFTIYAITVACSSVLSYVIPNYLDTDYPNELLELVQNTTRESMEKFNAPQESIDKAIEGMTVDKFKPSAVQALKGFGINLIVGLVLGLLIAVFVSRKPKNYNQTIDEVPQSS